MKFRNPQFFTKHGFSRHEKSEEQRISRIIKPVTAFSRPVKKQNKGISEEAAKQIASVIKEMLKRP